MIGKTNAVSGKITIPSVSNLNVNEDGDLTFDKPDYSKLAEYDPTISYIVDVNGTSFETTSNDINILHLLVEGENTVGVTVKAIIRHFSSDTSEDVMFSIPKDTNPTFFTLETTTVDNVNGYKITAYNGTDTKIIIPQYNTDGLPILELNSLKVPKINGSHIKKLNSFKNNTTITKVNFPETSNESFKEMFSGCSSLTKITNINTSNATNLRYMFYSNYTLKTIPLLNTSKVTDMEGMFSFCQALTSIPQLDTSSVKNMSYMFDGCSKLTEIPAFDVSNVNSFASTFHNCISLRTIHMTGMKASFDISESTQFTDNDLYEIIDNLATVTSTQTLTMGATNLAKVSEEYVAKATNKGWTLA